MTVYYILMVLIGGLAYPLCIRKPSKAKNTVYVCIVFTYMFAMAAFRYGLGNDYFHYRDIFYRVTDRNMSFSQCLKHIKVEPAYLVLMKIIAFFGGDYIVLNIIMALIILIPAAIVIIKHSKMPWVSCWLYLTVTFFYNSLNFTRQSAAASIVFLSLHYIKEKKHRAVILLTLGAALFHYSVLLFIPVYLMSLIKPSAKYLGIIGGSAIAVFLFSERILDFVLTYILTGYAKYKDTIYLTMGLSKVYLIIPLILAAIQLSAYYLNSEEKSPEAGVLANFSFYNLLIWIFILKHFILERFTMPIYIFSLINIPEALIFFKGLRLGENKNKGTRMADSAGKVEAFFAYAFKKGKAVFPAVTAFLFLATFTYNDFCITEGVHGVFPYRSVFDAVPAVSGEELRTNYHEHFYGSPLIEFLSLANKGDYTAVITVCADAGNKLDYPTKRLIRKLGFKTDINSLDGKSYVGAASNGKSIYEISSDELITEKLALCDNSVFVTAISGGKTAAAQTAQLIIDSENYAADYKGINIIIIDNDTRIPIASQAYDISTRDYRVKNAPAFVGKFNTSE